MPEVEIISPFDGEAVELERVPDPVFAEKMAGDGIALIPKGDLVVAPVSGILTKIFPGGHAFVVSTAIGAEILVHIGLDTYDLKGHGYTIIAQESQVVAAGDPIIHFDRNEIERLGKNLISPVISIGAGTIIRRRAGIVHAGKDILFFLKL